MKTKNFINRYDYFSAPVFGFNIDGGQRVGSGMGLCCSVLVAIITLVYATVKMKHLVEGNNPQVMFSEEHDRFETADDSFEYGSYNTSWAFYVEDDHTQEEKSDPSLVEWTAYVSDKNSSGFYHTYFRMHRCDENDLKHFYPPSKHISSRVSDLKERKVLWCINPSDVGAIYGRTTMDYYRKVEFQFSACIPKQLNSSNTHLQKTECLADYTNKTDLERKKHDSIEYIGKNP